MRNTVRLRWPELWSISNGLEGVVGVEAKFVFVINFRATILLFVMFALFFIEKFLNSHCWHLFQLRFVDLLDRVALVLQQVHQEHDLLLSELEVVDLIIHAGASVVQLLILLRQLAHVFKHLLPVLLSRSRTLQRLGLADLFNAYWQVRVGCRLIGEAQAHVRSIVSSNLQRA